MTSSRILLHGATIITSKEAKKGSIIIKGNSYDAIYPDKEGNIEYNFNGQEKSEKIRYTELPERFAETAKGEIYLLEGKHIISGGIDPHVHFRDPGLTAKADFNTESIAALLGGVTSIIDMPNTIPQTTDADTIAGKAAVAEAKCRTRFKFHIGATESNIDEIESLARTNRYIAGIKVFMGSSTGGMLVKSDEALEKIFRIKDIPVLVHCEDEDIIKANLENAISRYGEDIPFKEHPAIRSRKACIKSSAKALDLAIRYGTRLHLCHISTREEAEMVRAAKQLNPLITAETSANYLWFCDDDYERLGAHIKCNPAIKTSADREALIEAVRNGIIDCIGSDHAPHLIEEKQGIYTKVPSGIPSIQQTLPVLLTIASANGIPLTTIASVFSENAGAIFGFRQGAADFVVFDKDAEFTVNADDLAYKCGWSPYEGTVLKGKVEMTFINGTKITENGKFLNQNDYAAL